MKISALAAVLLLTAFGSVHLECPSEADIDGCESCWDPPLECAVCGAGWLWSDAPDYTCIRCPTHCAECIDNAYDEQLECLTCERGFYSDENNVCLECPTHCEECVDGWTCSVCEEGYHESDTLTTTCDSCTAGCSRCQDGGEDSCYQCLDGYYYISRDPLVGSCIACGENCLHCTSANSCDQCADGTTWTGSSCQECIENCDPDFCVTNDACVRCLEGFFLTQFGDQCKSCAHCADCPYNDGCLECESGYLLTPDGTCHACPDVDNAANCLQCGTDDRGRYIDSDLHCAYCPLHCSVCSNSLLCTACIDGYYLDHNSICQICNPSCETCHASGADACDSCEEGFGLVDETCDECPSATGVDHCVLCTGETCDDCEENYYLSPTPTDGEWMCRPCSEADPDSNTNTCNSCVEVNQGRFFSDDKCISCDSFGAACQHCTTTECTLCEDTWYIDNTGSCARCNDTVNCLECASEAEGDCVVCGPGYHQDNGFCRSCPAGCDYCIDDITCDVCASGRTLPALSFCPECEVENCASCTENIRECMTCEAGYNRVSATECRQCTVQDCIRCSVDPNICEACAEGTVYDAAHNHCAVQCIEGCADCASVANDDNSFFGGQWYDIDVSCTQCKDGYVSFSVGHCMRCEDPHCIDCPSDPSCLACEEGYYLNSDGACTPCAPEANCRRCNSNSPRTCLSCPDGFHIHSFYCLDCSLVHSACTECEYEVWGECTACSSGYVVVNGMCEACNSACLTCQDVNQDYCLTCAGGLWANSGTCIDCSQQSTGCIECTGTSAGQCSTCDDGYWDNSGDCAACHSSCATCDGATNTDCTDCDAGIHLAGTTCLDCSTQSTGCEQCTATTPGTCTQCGDGYHDDGGGNCVACHSSCLTCSGSGPTACTDCHGDEYLDTNTCYDCSVIDPQCNECSGETAGDCTACSDGYFYDSTDMACYACFDSNCLECNDGTKGECTSCHSDYFLKDGACYECSAYDHCTNCVTTTGCDTCDDLYRVDTVVTCLKCPDHCNTCESSLKCTDCESGYFVDTNGNCTACSENCDECASATECTLCNDGYMIDAMDECEACPVGCEMCTSSTVCGSCLPGYRMVGTLCTGVCPPGCDECTADNQCTTCAAGRSLVEICPECLDDHCVACTTVEHCTECETGYYIDQIPNTCESCSANCDVCTAGACLVCSDGFQLSGAVCADIASSRLTNCEIDDGTDCIECEDGFYLDPESSLCVDCEDVSPDDAVYVCDQCAGTGGAHGNVQHWIGECYECPENCVSCTASNTCSDCFRGYYTDGTACFEVQCDDLSVIEHSAECLMCSEANQDKNDEHRGVYWDGTSCNECAKNCETCTSPTVCTSCMDHHIWDSTENACVDCSFSDRETCLGCVDSSTTGRFLHADGSCLRCPDECTSCTDESTCTSCSSTHYLRDDACYPCTDTDITRSGCYECQEKYAPWQTNVHTWVLTMPAIGNTLATYECLECPSNCAECDEVDTCRECFPSMYFYTDDNVQECRTCMTNCDVCINANTCKLCSDGYYYIQADTGNRCQTCPTNCASCHETEGCLECASGYYLDADKNCQSCSVAITSCAQCELSGSSVRCLTCNERYFPADLNGVTDGQCAGCITNCLHCDDAETCTDCAANHCYDEAEKVCRAHGGSNCETCQLIEEVVSCLTCEPLKFLNLCQGCDDERCVSCPNDVSVCTACINGTYIDDQGHCEGCLPDCASCENGDTCVVCKEGTFWHEGSRSCAPCPNMCLECADSFTCLTCSYSNMFLLESDEDNTCTFCALGCSACTNSTNCLVCEEGFRSVLDEDGLITDCIACTEGCASCDASGCIHCVEGFAWTTQSTCLDCSTFSNCELCGDYNYNSAIDEGECDSCREGFVMSHRGDQCIECTIPGCSECQDRPYVCDECEEGLIPTPDHYECGVICWMCHGDEECEIAPQMNDTHALAEDSAYSTVGCPTGCQVIRNATSEGVVFTRGCYEGEECPMDEEGVEMCGEETADGVSQCSLCCTEEMCNIQELQGSSSAPCRPLINTLTLYLLVTVAALALLL